ncbi:FecR domain-containing protein [Achromobacter insuavis]
MSAPALPAAVEAAVDWMVLLSSGEASAADRARFEAWHRTDPRHAAAWDMVTGALDSTFAPLGEGASSRAAGAALLAPTSRRRALRNALMLALAAGGLAALVDRQTPLRTLAADLRTGTGERHVYPLPDGSVVTLNARSAVDLQFDDRARVLRLREGAVYVRVAADAARPFIVASPDGEVQALGTVFGVARDARGSVACVIEHSVEIRAAGQRRTLAAGEGARFGAHGIGAPDAALAEAAAWHDGMLVVRDQPLGEVVAALRPYRRGFLRISPEAARLRVLGAFPLDDTDRVLESLRQTLPIEVARLGGWLVSIDLRADAAEKMIARGEARWTYLLKHPLSQEIPCSPFVPRRSWRPRSSSPWPRRPASPRPRRAPNRARPWRSATICPPRRWPRP